MCPEQKCPNENRCYLNSDRCNGRYDCSDGYDEQGCRKCFKIFLEKKLSTFGVILTKIL